MDQPKPSDTFTDGKGGKFGSLVEGRTVIYMTSYKGQLPRGRTVARASPARPDSSSRRQPPPPSIPALTLPALPADAVASPGPLLRPHAAATPSSPLHPLGTRQEEHGSPTSLTGEVSAADVDRGLLRLDRGLSAASLPQVGSGERDMDEEGEEWEGRTS